MTGSILMHLRCRWRVASMAYSCRSRSCCLPAVRILIQMPQTTRSWVCTRCNSCVYSVCHAVHIVNSCPGTSTYLVCDICLHAQKQRQCLLWLMLLLPLFRPLPPPSCHTRCGAASSGSSPASAAAAGRTSASLPRTSAGACSTSECKKAYTLLLARPPACQRSPICQFKE